MLSSTRSITPQRAGRGSAVGRVALEGNRSSYPRRRGRSSRYSATGYQRAFGFRTYPWSAVSCVEGTTIGVFALTRDKVEPIQPAANRASAALSPTRP